MANWFTKAIDKVTPWDRGGEAQRRREEDERRRQQQQMQRQAAAPRPAQTPQPQPIQNLLQDTLAGKNNPKPIIDLGLQNKVSVPQIQDYSTQAVDAPVKPKQGFFNKIRDKFDANTEADKYRRTVASSRKLETQLKDSGVDPARAKREADRIAVATQTPVRSGADNVRDFGKNFVRGVAQIPSATARVATGAIEGGVDLAGGATTLVNAPLQFIRHGTVRGSSNNAVNNASGTLKDRVFHPVNRFIDKSAEVIGGEDNMQNYRNIQIGENIIGLATGVGELSGAAKGSKLIENASEGSKLAAIKNFLGGAEKQLSASDEIADVVSRASNPALRLAHNVVNAPIKGTRNALRVFTRNAAKDASEAQAIGEVGDLLSETQLDDLMRTRVPVGADVPVTGGEGIPQPIPVRNLTESGPLIREFPGDAPNVTRVPTASDALEQRAATRFANQDFPIPDGNIEGVTPRTIEPFTLDRSATLTTQDKLVDDYADFLRSVGEGNGVDIGPDGQRISNNVRFGETGGKKMSKAAWREEAARQLSAGEADPAIQKAFDEATNPEIQSLLTAGEQTPAPSSPPVKVKEVQGINVTENVDVPQDLPETPGKVRMSTKTDPLAAKTEQVASATPAPAKKAASEATQVAESTPTPPKTQADNLGAPINRAGESTEAFLKRTALPIQDNITRASRALKDVKKARKSEKGGRVSQAIAAKQAILDSGGTHQEASKAYWKEMGGKYSTPNFEGKPIAKEDANRIYSMVDEHYGPEMSMTAENTKRSFDNLFNSGSDDRNVIPSDLRNVRRFLNQMVPEANLGDAAETAIKEMDAVTDGVSRTDKAIALQRAIRFTADASATLRQALPEGLANPISFGKAVKESFAAMFNKGRYEKLIKKLENDKETQYIQDRLKIGLSMLESGSKKGDDIYRNEDWVQKIPGVRAVVSASERQYNTMLTVLRHDIAKNFIKDSGGIASLEKAAQDSGHADVFLRAFGEAVNTGSGRGGKAGGVIDKHGDFLSKVFISPRNLSAKLQRLNPAWYNRLWKENPAAAKEAIRTSLIQAAITGTVLTAAAQSGNYEDGKVRVGNTRYDVTGGLATIFNAVKDMHDYVSGNKEASFYKNAGTELDNFLKNQMAPLVQTVYSGLYSTVDKSGKRVDRFGEEITAKGTALKNLTPIGVENAFQEAKDGVPTLQRGVNAGLNTLGIGVNTYKSGQDKKNDKEQDIRQKNAALSKYIPKDTYELTDDVIKGAADDAYWAGDWEAYAEGAQAKLNKLNENQNSTKENRSKAEQEVKRANFIKSKGEKFTPEDLDQYDNIGVEQWRNMGDPEDDDYNPDAYQKLWEIDKAMAEGGVSSNTQQGKGPNDPKYTLKEKKGGSGSRGGGGSKAKLVTNFGTLDTPGTAPKVRGYDTEAMSGGGIPRISVKRPNIVYKIGTRG